MPEIPVTINWLVTRPCVIDGRVVVDVRGAWPVVYPVAQPMMARSVETRDEFFMFVAECLS